MKKRLSILLPLSGAVAFAVRLLQQHVGFEAETGLPVHGLLFALPVLLLMLVWFLAVRPISADDAPVLPQSFSMNKTSLLLPVAGVFLLALSGLGWLFFGLLPHTSTAIAADGTMVSVVTTGALSFANMAILGILSLVMSVSLFLAVAALREHQGEPKPFPAVLLLPAPVALTVRLILIYRVNSIDPSLAHYVAELSAVVFLTLAFCQFSGFGYGLKGSRRFTLLAGWAAILSLATLADGHSMPDTLFYLGSALTLSGLLFANRALETT